MNKKETCKSLIGSDDVDKNDTVNIKKFEKIVKPLSGNCNCYLLVKIIVFHYNQISSLLVNPLTGNQVGMTPKKDNENKPNNTYQKSGKT